VYYYLAARLIAVGICLFAGMLYCLIGVRQRESRIFFAFGCTSLLFAAYIASTIITDQSHTPSQVLKLGRVDIGILCLLYPTSVWFFSLYTRLRVFWPWLLAACIVFGIFFVLNIVLPNGVAYNSVESLHIYRLPWGEPVTRGAMALTLFSWPFHIMSYLVYLWCIWRCLALLRARAWQRGWPMAAYVIAQTILVLFFIFLPLPEYAQTIRWYELAFLLLVVIMSLTLRAELHARGVALGLSLSRLEAESGKRNRVIGQLHRMAYHDALTGLPNALGLHERLTEALVRSAQDHRFGALLLISLDNFTNINAALGRVLADQLLKQIALRLHATLPDAYCIARLGRDEFAVLLAPLDRTRSASEHEALHCAEALVANLTQPIRIESEELMVGVCTGISLFIGPSHNETSVLREADVALFSSRHGGPEVVAIYNETMETATHTRLEIEKGLRLALEHQDLELYFQPLRNGQASVPGAEALLRWRHHGQILRLPDEFIPIAEESGLIRPIGEYALEQACHIIRRLQSSVLRPPATISVNVSTRQLLGGRFSKQVLRIVGATGIDPRLLALELTPSAHTSGFQDGDSSLREIADAGVRLTLDRFGSSHASFANLRGLPFREIKIDRSLVAEIHIEPTDRFVKSIIDIAANLKIDVTAVGVETETQRRALESMGCVRYQGYLFSRPLPAGDLLAWWNGIEHP
jgi:diguanylate cyclase (GGDEF)-like protein